MNYGYIFSNENLSKCIIYLYYYDHKLRILNYNDGCSQPRSCKRGGCVALIQKYGCPMIVNRNLFIYRKYNVSPMLHYKSHLSK